MRVSRTRKPQRNKMRARTRACEDPNSKVEVICELTAVKRREVNLESNGKWERKKIENTTMSDWRSLKRPNDILIHHISDIRM